MNHKRQHFVGNIVCLCEVVDRAAFSDTVARHVFPDSHRARLWADSYIARKRLDAMRKYDELYEDALFGLEATFIDVEFDPPRLSIEWDDVRAG